MTGGPTATPHRTGGEAGEARCVVTVCRGCCCGTQAKHPDVDHPAQLDRLRNQAGPSLVRVSDCLDACEHSNVIVVTPSPAGRRAGARPVWLGEVLDAASTAVIAGWVAAGGPGLVDVPTELDPHRFQPGGPEVPGDQGHN